MPFRNDPRWIDLIRFFEHFADEARAAERAARHAIPIIAKYDPTARP